MTYEQRPSQKAESQIAAKSSSELFSSAGIHTSTAIIAQSSIPGFRLLNLDKSRSITASNAREIPTIAVTEMVLVLFRNGRLQIPSVILFIATEIRRQPRCSIQQTYQEPL